MARIRSAKPEFWTDPVMCALPRDVRFTFKGLWEVMADDFGRFQADPRLVKAAVWPLEDDITTKKLGAWLDLLAAKDRIQLYDMDGVQYGVVVNWAKHQKVSHPSPSQHPAPPPEPYRKNSGIIPEPLPNDSALIGKERRGEDKERSGEAAPLADAPDSGTAPVGSRRATATASLAAQVEALPDGAREFLATFWPAGSAAEERRKKATEIVALLETGTTYKGQRIPAQPRDRLDAKCRLVLREGVRDAGKAMAVLLTKLGDTTDLAIRREAEAQRAKVEEQRPNSDLPRARAWLVTEPAIAAEIGAQLDREFPDTPDGRKNPGRGAADIHLVLTKWRAAGSPDVLASTRRTA